MRSIAIALAMVLAMAVGHATAADPTPASSSLETAPSDEREKLLEAGTQFMLGNYDEALDAGRALLRSTRHDAIRTGAARLVAESVRKKRQWKPAAAAYSKLAEYYAKGSDEALCNDLAKTESEFQNVLVKVPELDRAEGRNLWSDSDRRQSDYARLAREFAPPPMRPGAGDWGRGVGGGWGRGGVGGMGRGR